MTPQNTRAVCGTAMIITAVAVKAAFGGSIELWGLTLMGLTLLVVSMVPPAPPPTEGGYNHSYYR